MKIFKIINNICLVLITVCFIVITINITSVNNKYDLDNNGEVNARDLLILQKYILENN